MINVALALENVDFNKINITFVDGLSIDKLKIRYNWIFNAIIEDAILGEDDYGLVWYSGTWLNGEWYDGTWYSGNFIEGIWKNGNFYSYKFNKYDIVNGNFNIINKDNSNSVMTKVTWENGNFYGGTFGNNEVYWTNYNINYDVNNPFAENDVTKNTMGTNVWKKGNFHNGIFFHSIWYNGNWYDGYCENVQWFNGNWYNGEFNGFVWYNGTFLGGDFVNGTWYDGTFSTFDTNTKSRFGTTIDKGINSSIFYYVSGITNWNTPTNYNQFSSGLTWDESNILQKISKPLDTNSAIYTAWQNVLDQHDMGSKYLSFNTFNFNIPEGSTISGIEVRLSLYKEGTGNVKDIHISLSNTNEYVLYENKATNTELGYPEQYMGLDIYDWTFTGGTQYDTWGRNWTRNEINSDDFDINIKLSLYKSGMTDDVRAYLTGLEIKVHYQRPLFKNDYTKCKWINGIFNNGEFHSGLYVDSSGNTLPSENNNLSVWLNGTFNNGKWYGGKFQNGTWNNGEFYSGFFGTDSNIPIWYNGIFYNGYWINGKFYDGEYYGGIAKNIEIHGGNIGN